jgi:hypothetical protein
VKPIRPATRKSDILLCRASVAADSAVRAVLAHSGDPDGAVAVEVLRYGGTLLQISVQRADKRP